MAPLVMSQSSGNSKECGAIRSLKDLLTLCARGVVAEMHVYAGYEQMMR